MGPFWKSIPLSLLLCLAVFVSAGAASGISVSHSSPPPDAAAKLAAPSMPGSGSAKPPFAPPFTSIAPVKLFDNLYFVGTTAVGAFLIDTGVGLILLDTGCGADDAALMTADMKRLGLNPAGIKLILLSHEHFDHYGGVQYFKTNVCPKAKVAMSLVGWNMLQTVPPEWTYLNPRPQAVDLYLTDGMRIALGATAVQVVATPGHSAGCMSFIFPVTDGGVPHVVGIMGGSAVWTTQLEARQYKASIEYFKAH
ncbi:MAG: MBL fold metallo-hydrolase, partial [Humidesulfovibrio sp.]|nr:MBL fold metallo-hydrolase [Humidesulfovibrio sp.]